MKEKTPYEVDIPHRVVRVCRIKSALDLAVMKNMVGIIWGDPAPARLRREAPQAVFKGTYLHLEYQTFGSEPSTRKNESCVRVLHYKS